MGWRDWFRRPPEKRSITLADIPSLASILAGTSSAGMTVSPHTAFHVRAFFQGVGIVSVWPGILPLVTYRRAADDERERATSLPAYRLLHDAPNPYTVPIVFWQTIMAHALTWGNGYAEIEFDNADRPKALWNVPPDKLEPVVEGAPPKQRLVYRYAGSRTIPATDILHIPGLGFDGIKGYSVISMARRSLGTAMAAEEFGASFFGNGAWPGVVLEHPGKLSPEAQNRLVASVELRHQGAQKSNRTMVAEEGMKVKKIGIPPDDAQFLETREFGVVDVAGWLNLSPHMLGHRPGEWPGGTPEAADRHFFTHTLQPWLVRIQQECNRKLLPSTGGYYTEHLPEALLRMSPEAKAQNYKVYFDMGVLTAEQIARKENLPKPEPKPEPAQAPATAPAPMMEEPKARAAFRALMVDVAERFVRREADRARRASKKGPEHFATWVDMFYNLEVDSLASHLAPVVTITTLHRGFDQPRVGEEARAIAIAHVEKSREELLDLRKDDLQSQVERLTKRWEKDRPTEMADRIAALDAAQGEGNAA
jgi:HK97 family phage portal protein